jgi:hypothetical protein
MHFTAKGLHKKFLGGDKWGVSGFGTNDMGLKIRFWIKGVFLLG